MGMNIENFVLFALILTIILQERNYPYFREEEIEAQ